MLTSQHPTKVQCILTFFYTLVCIHYNQSHTWWRESRRVQSRTCLYQQSSKGNHTTDLGQEYKCTARNELSEENSTQAFALALPENCREKHGHGSGWNVKLSCAMAQLLQHQLCFCTGMPKRTWKSSALKLHISSSITSRLSSQTSPKSSSLNSRAHSFAGCCCCCSCCCEL